MKVKTIRHSSRYTDRRPSIAERVVRRVRNLLKKPVFEKGNADWISELPCFIKSIIIHFITLFKWHPFKLVRKWKKSVCQSPNETQQKKLKFKLGQFVRTADITKVFVIGDSKNWSYKLYTITEVTHDTFPSNRVNYLPDIYNENLSRSTNLTLYETNKILRELNLIKLKQW